MVTLANTAHVFTQPKSGVVSSVFLDSTNLTSTVYIRQIQPIHIFII